MKKKDVAKKMVSYKGKKGQGSLNSPGVKYNKKDGMNEGEMHYLGKDEQPVA